MSRYSVGASFSGINTANRAYALLKAGANKQLRILRITIACSVIPTTAPLFRLLRQTAAGVTPGASATPQALLNSDVAADARLETGGYGTQPTLSSTPMDVAALPLVAGAAWVWNFPIDSPLIVPSGTANGLAIENNNASGATTGTFAASFLYDE
jgi:hypothetical protein